MIRGILAAMAVAVLVIAVVPATAAAAEIPEGTPVFNESTQIKEVSEGVYTIEFDNSYSVSDNYLDLPSDATSVTINGNGNTLYGGIRLDVLLNEGDTSHFDVTIENLTLDGSWHTGQYYGVHAMNQNPATNAARTVGFEMKDCTVQGFGAKGVYLVNVTDVLLDNVTFIDNATDADPYPDADHLQYYRWGDYALDIDVTGTTCSSIEITNCTFTGDCGDLAAVKIAQRGGANDGDSMGTASIGSVTFTGNDFSSVSSETPCDILIGSEPNVSTDGNATLRDYNSAFPVSIVSSGATDVSIWGDDIWGGSNLNIGLYSGTRVSFNGATTADGHGNIEVEILDGIADVSGAMGTNVSLVADDGSSVRFHDFTNVGGNTVTIREDAEYSGNPGSNLVVESSPTTPSPGWSDDDDEYVPPAYVVQDSGSGSDNTTTVVACAAAAVVAALIAVFLIIERRKI